MARPDILHIDSVGVHCTECPEQEETPEMFIIWLDQVYISRSSHQRLHTLFLKCNKEDFISLINIILSLSLSLSSRHTMSPAFVCSDVIHSIIHCWWSIQVRNRSILKMQGWRYLYSECHCSIQGSVNSNVGHVQSETAAYKSYIIKQMRIIANCIEVCWVS